MEGDNGHCFLCTKAADQLCPYCRRINFCCDNHLAYHRGDDICFPFQVVFKAGKGKSLVATRDISASDLIMRDRALVMCPYTKTKALCLQCHSRLSGRYKCPRCGFPMCNQECASGDLHRVECKILEDQDFEAEVGDMEVKDASTT